jgi:hypothetical protein
VGQIAVARRLGRVDDWGLPAEQEEVTAAKFAAVGSEDELQKALDLVSEADLPKIDRAAMWAFGG